MALKMKVSYIDGREEIVTVRPPTMMAAEKRFKRDGGMNERNRMEASFFMAWYPLHTTGKEPAEFAEFLESVDSIEDYEDEPEDPTEPAAQPDESSS